jgi:hypothetical protein
MSPDISMCKNEECPKKETCYRFKAIPDSYQSYGLLDWKDCEYYWEIKD